MMFAVATTEARAVVEMTRPGAVVCPATAPCGRIAKREQKHGQNVDLGPGGPTL